MHVLIHNALSFVCGFVLMSFIEYATHRWMLHKNSFIRIFPRVKKFDEVLVDHVVKHHGHFYKCFNHEDDPEGKLAGLFFPLGYYEVLVVFISLPLLYFDWVLALYVTGFFAAHYYFWNLFHKVMHFDVTPARILMPWFRYVEYYHYMHHQHPNKNFNGCFPPLWDVLLRTSARETEADREIWRLLQNGVVVDRRGRPVKK